VHFPKQLPLLALVAVHDYLIVNFLKVNYLANSFQF